MFLHKRAEGLNKSLQGFGIEPLVVMPIVFVLLLFLVSGYNPDALSGGLALVVVLSPLWLPMYLGAFFIISWVDYIRYLFWFSQNPILLEVQLPQTVDKNPAAIEVFLSTLHNAGGESTLISRLWKGSFRPIWSLEIASNEGRIGYYIHLRREWRNIIEARLYGQFPEAKIAEVEDYVSRVPFNLQEYDYFGAEYEKGEIGALPIRTYTDLKLDEDPKEEFKIDPLTNVLELLSQVGPGEYFWLQIILKTRRNGEEWYGFRTKGDHFKEPAMEEVERVMTGAAKRAQKLVEQEKIEQGRMVTMTKNEGRRIERIEESLSKLIFECGIRVAYLAKKENFKGINVGGIIRFFDAFKGQYGDREYNSLGVTRGNTIFNYPWQDFMDIRSSILKKTGFFHYKNRAYFYVPYDQVPIYMNTAELATIWHFPSTSVQTPGLNRVPSRRAEAPVNLPTA